MITLYRGTEVRPVKESRVQEYLAAGWTTTAVKKEQVEERITLRPTARVKAADKTAEDDAITKGDE
jgi:hypothetical protein